MGALKAQKRGAPPVFSSSRRQPPLIMAATSNCCLYSEGKCNIDINSSNSDIELMHCECVDCDRCLPLRQKPELYGRIETHPGTCGFYDRLKDRNRCFECHHYCGERVEYTDSEREELLGGYRLNSVVDHFMTEMSEGRFGEGALTPEVIAVVSNLTQDIVYELEKRYDEGTTPIATLLEELGVLPSSVTPVEAIAPPEGFSGVSNVSAVSFVDRSNATSMRTKMNSTAGDIEKEAMASAPDLARIKCVKRKYYMMHKDDNRWYQYSRKEVDELTSPVVVDGILHAAGPYAWEMRDLSKRGFELRQGARKKRVVHGSLTDPPSGALSTRLTPHQTENLPQCVQACIRLLNLSCKVPVNVVTDVLNAMDGFLKPVKWGWEGLDVCNLKNCIEKLIELAQPTDLFILQTHHTDTNTSRHCCCIKERMLCCPSEKKWRPLSLVAFEVLYIDRIIRIYKK